MSAILVGNHLSLIGVVGRYWGDEDVFDHSEVVGLLLGMRNNADLKVSINSPGGSCSDGVGIYNALKAHRGRVHVVVDGLAASAGSLIAMAGDRITMRTGSLMMLHEARTTAVGANSVELAAHVRQQAAWNESVAAIYAARSGKTIEQVKDLLLLESWYTATQAVEAGLADDIDGDIVDLNRVAPAFAYQNYSRAPASLITLAKTNNWLPHGAATSSVTAKEPIMSNENASAAARTAATARIKAIMKADEAAGRQELAEHLAFNTDMDPAAAIAVMKVSPTGEEEFDPLAYRRRPDGQMNGAGLNTYSRNVGATGGLVDAMKQRHGVK